LTRKKICEFVPDADNANLSEDLTRLSEIIEACAPGLGRKLVIKIAKEFAGTYVYFQQDDKIFRDERDQWIIEQYEAGHKVPEIARGAPLCERQVWNILGREPGQDKQLKLF
jgi:Mor family transcriptional regulator